MFTVQVFMSTRDVIAKKKNNEMAANSFCGHFISKNIELELQNDYRHGKYWASFLIFTF